MNTPLPERLPVDAHGLLQVLEEERRCLRDNVLYPQPRLREGVWSEEMGYGQRGRRCGQRRWVWSEDERGVVREAGGVVTGRGCEEKRGMVRG